MPKVEKNLPGSFSWIELATTDQEGAKRFYTSLFGWDVIDHPMGPNEVYSTFQLQGLNVGATYSMRPEQRSQGVPSHWLLYIATPNADNTAARAKELGANILAPAFDVFDMGRMAVIQDPTGAAFAVWQAYKSEGLEIVGEINTLSWADLSTNNVENAKRFYKDLFGWKVEVGEKDPTGYMHIQNGDVMIGGIPPSKYRDPGTPPFWMIYFAVTDCDAVTAKAKELGGAVYMPPSTMEDVLRIAILADPQGGVFALFQDLKASR
ncbi:MAG TPA: VOC family protein [Bryobacteraceae bacterium]|nr:VOC family protein [Bryobacteraceae bacterium]